MAHKPYDSAVRDLIRDYLPDWQELLLAGAGMPATPGQRLRMENTAMGTVVAEPDFLFTLGRGPGAPLLHMEVQTSLDPELEQRTHQYNTLASDDGTEVRSLFVLLRRAAERASAPYSGTFIRTYANGDPWHTFHYRVVRVWQLSPERLFAAGPGLWPLALLTDAAAADPAPVAAELSGRVDQLPLTQSRVKEYWGRVGMLMGVRYNRVDIDSILKRRQVLRDSSYYQAALQEGEERGLKLGQERGEQRGRLEEARQILLNLHVPRLGEPDAAQREAILALADGERLRRMIAAGFALHSWIELLEIE